ncbi:MAG: hypothetical protein RL641_331 [Candidatus Parcubacteria bacterium]|jgi:hypothetical protein
MKKFKEALVKLNHNGTFIIVMILVTIIVIFPLLFSFGKSLFAPFINPVKSSYSDCPQYLSTIQAETGDETYCVAWPRLILNSIWPLKFSD